MPLLPALLSAGLSAVAGKIAAAVDRRVTSRAEREELKAELAQELHRYEQELLELAAQAEREQLADLQHARRAAVDLQAVATASWLSRNVAYLLDLFLATIWGACTIYLVLRALKLVDGAQLDLTGVLAIYSTVTATFMTSLTFHRGTSRGSEVKDAALRAQLDRREEGPRG